MRDVITKLTRHEIAGCCSDYTQVFIALASANGLFAREVRIEGHVFAEVYFEKAQKWVWVDPQFGMTAKGPDGLPMSFLELRQKRLQGEGIVFRDHRKGVDLLAGEISAELRGFYAPERFKKATMLLGNNVYAEYLLDKKYSNLPKALRQIVAYALEVKPTTLVHEVE